MLSSPVWRGSPALAFCAGLVIGGMTSAAALVVAGSLVRHPLPPSVRWTLVGGTLGLALLKEWGAIKLRLPENRRLVPESVFRLGRHLGPLQFGMEMGTGVRTYLPSALPYVAAAGVLLVASLPAALVAGAGFGLGRSLMTTANLRYGRDGGWDGAWQRHGRVLSLMVSVAFTIALVTLSLSTSPWR